MPQQQPQHTNSPHRNAFRRIDRVRRRCDFLRIQRCGQKVYTAHFILLIQANRERRRLGITVTKHVSNSVGRNRVKRVLREVFRINPRLFPEMSDVVVIARSGAERLNYGNVYEELEKASGALERAARVSRECTAIDIQKEPSNSGSAKK